MTERIPANVLEETLSIVKFDQNGLVPAIAQQHDSGEVLMMAWMSAESISETFATGEVCYWSRSRAKLWKKGETSGQTQSLVDFRIDCDGDTILLFVDQKGVACHTGRKNCFYTAARPDGMKTISEIEVPPDELYQK
jgi:phosphoribosyl-AMP cyclohydrolase